MGYSPEGHKESDKTEAIEHAPTWEKNLKRMHIYVYMNTLNRLAIHLKLTQYYKSTVVAV